MSSVVSPFSGPHSLLARVPVDPAVCAAGRLTAERLPLEQRFQAGTENCLHRAAFFVAGRVAVVQGERQGFNAQCRCPGGGPARPRSARRPDRRTSGANRSLVRSGIRTSD